ncbi:MAG: hypothetical protein WC934_04915 [Acidithiobacillus sp.]|jgi:hypothetical protein|uniref:hypothetical protein n=1 Tax=Acidithiobacillus sp. TaxID=1872118 RepID=UPI00356052A6
MKLNKYVKIEYEINELKEINNIIQEQENDMKLFQNNNPKRIKEIRKNLKILRLCKNGIFSNINDWKECVSLINNYYNVLEEEKPIMKLLVKNINKIKICDYLNMGN